MRGIDVIPNTNKLTSTSRFINRWKNWYKLRKFKNIIGTFYQPKFTYINVNALKTLPQDEFISGMAEVIKYSVIYDYDFLDYLIENSEDILK